MTSPKRRRRNTVPPNFSIVLFRILAVLGLAALGVHGGNEYLDGACERTDLDSPLLARPLWVSQKCDIDL